LLEKGEDTAEKMLEVAAGGGSGHPIKRRRLGAGQGPEKSASELAAALPGSTEGEIRLWFPVRDGAVAHVHDEAAALEASLEALEFGDVTVMSNMKVILKNIYA
jgi:hypothetical protein